VAIIVLADRAFGRAEWARTCLGLPQVHFLLRIKPDVGVRHPRYRGLLRDYPVRPGIGRVLRQAAYRLTDPVTLNVVIRWKKGLPAHRDEPWFLITDLPGRAAALTALFARRMAVEELFRDDKSLRNGWALRLTQSTKPGRFDRLLLVLALAYGLLVGLGLLARLKYRPAFWCSTNREKGGRWQCSAFTIGRAVRALVRAAERGVPGVLYRDCQTHNKLGMTQVRRPDREGLSHDCAETEVCCGRRSGACFVRSRGIVGNSRVAVAPFAVFIGISDPCRLPEGQAPPNF
jgi:hypothetical protein